MPWYFAGFAEPNYTQIPDAFFDEVMCHLTEAELRVCLYIMRRTFGFKKREDAISFNQFLKGIHTRDGRQLDEGCGISGRSNLARALAGLEEKGVITARKYVGEKGDAQATVYSLRFRGVVPQSDYPIVRVVPQSDYPPGHAALPPAVTLGDLQETGSQDDRTDQETGRSSMISNANQLEKLMIQVSHELGDGAHARSNISRLRNLVEGHGNATDEEVARIVQGAYRRTLDTKPRNPMAYAFTLIEQQLTLVPQKRSLAGKYAHLVRHLEPSDQSEGQGSLPVAETALKSHPGASRGHSRGRRPTTKLGGGEAELASRNRRQTNAPAAANIGDPAVLWSAVRGELEQTVTRPIFETYLRDTEHATEVEGRLVVQAPSDFAAEWLDRKLRPAVQQTLARVAGRPVDVTFTVREPDVNEPGDARELRGSVGSDEYSR